MSQPLGKYQILEKLGRGGFATVYCARDPDLDRQVALKVLHPTLMTDPAFVERFRREARAAGRLHHPGIVTIYEIGEAEGRLYIAMELLPGPALAHVIEAEAPMIVDRAVGFLQPLAVALDYAHAQGVIHRDLKPANVILSTQRRPVLTDFGLVRAAGGEASTARLTLSQTGTTLGTPAYMAPEQCDPEFAGPLDHRADLYSLGVVAYEMLTARVPFRATTPLQVAMGHLMTPPPDPKSLNPELSDLARLALLKQLSKRGEQRFHTATAFVHALSESTSSPVDEPPTRPDDRARLAPVRKVEHRACPRCQAQVPAANRFCQRCGERLDASAPQVVKVASPPAAQPTIKLSGGWHWPRRVGLLSRRWAKDARLSARVTIVGVSWPNETIVHATEDYFSRVGFRLAAKDESSLSLERGWRSGRQGTTGASLAPPEAVRPLDNIANYRTRVRLEFSFDESRHLLDIQLAGRVQIAQSMAADPGRLAKEVKRYPTALRAALATERRGALGEEEGP